MRVYVAGPYTHGGRLSNVHRALDAADTLIDAGHAPYIPHLSHFQDARRRRTYEEWLALDFAWLAVCEALIRLPGYSPGADREVEEAQRLGIPVYDSVAAFLEAVGGHAG